MKKYIVEIPDHDETTSRSDGITVRCDGRYNITGDIKKLKEYKDEDSISDELEQTAMERLRNIWKIIDDCKDINSSYYQQWVMSELH